jgi:hypothetical protein
MQVALSPALQLLVTIHNNGMAAVEEPQGQGDLMLSFSNIAFFYFCFVNHIPTLRLG